ncbi:hypothetical protein [Rhodococcus opacus]|uniref:hypothetical protein n=1 Tax=Rhodococcus opacus TaxID=37919 RepID=UPI000A713064|nr:hypothetical protein [Rhodococcus opacus]
MFTTRSEIRRAYAEACLGVDIDHASPEQLSEIDDHMPDLEAATVRLLLRFDHYSPMVG